MHQTHRVRFDFLMAHASSASGTRRIKETNKERKNLSPQIRFQIALDNHSSMPLDHDSQDDGEEDRGRQVCRHLESDGNMDVWTYAFK